MREGIFLCNRERRFYKGRRGIYRLWEEANACFGEVAHLARKDENGNIAGIWGAMSDFSRSFKPWGNRFTEGLYLAGIEAADGAEAPRGWVKWIIPGYEYVYVKCTEDNLFEKMLKYLEEQGLTLAGAVHDFNCPAENGQGYMFFPVRRL